jgi:F0F1-type ATP synthase assembly protein I
MSTSALASYLIVVMTVVVLTAALPSGMAKTSVFVTAISGGLILTLKR